MSFSGFAAEDDAASKAEPASAAFSNVANSFGVLYPKLLCGRSSLYSFRHAAIFRRASNPLGWPGGNKVISGVVHDLANEGLERPRRVTLFFLDLAAT